MQNRNQSFQNTLFSFPFNLIEVSYIWVPYQFQASQKSGFYFASSCCYLRVAPNGNFLLRSGVVVLWNRGSSIRGTQVLYFENTRIVQEGKLLISLMHVQIILYMKSPNNRKKYLWNADMWNAMAGTKKPFWKCIVCFRPCPPAVEIIH